ncbi:MAG: glutamine synthetase [Alphaproteobacteria bacterium]|nr:glutamine synthetase [Alphaproteobacteria bacterium]
MRPEQVKNARDARKLVEQRGLSHVKVGVFDIDGILRGKLMHRDKFLSALEGGFGFCDVVYGWDANDVCYDNVRFTGWHTGYPDAAARLVPETCRDLPLEFDGKGLFFLGELEGKGEAICPRNLVKRLVKRANDMGYEPYSAVEYEFFVFEETPYSVREKGYRNLKPFTPGNFGYSVIRSSVQNTFHEELLALGERMRFPLEGLHTETGPGVLEAAITFDKTLESCDRAALFKTFSKVVAEKRGLMATFMSKWSPHYPGQSGHIHMSLKDRKSGKSVFHDPRKPRAMSDAMRHFIGGQQALMPEFLAMVAATVNAYRRLIPGFWAPTQATWGIENRTTALRAIPGSPKSQRIEYRVASADGNPYVAVAAALASGLHGIAHKIEPTDPISGNAYDAKLAKRHQFPRTLTEAAERLAASKPAREMLGDAFVEHFAATREWEEREFRKHISDWELARYFEII